MKTAFASLFVAAFATASFADNPALPPPTEGGTPTEKVEQLQQLFQGLDTENRGFLTREQMSTGLGLGQESFQNLDQDGDGVISREEFLTLSLDGAAKGTESNSQPSAEDSHYLDRDPDDSETEQKTQPQDRTGSETESDLR